MTRLAVGAAVRLLAERAPDRISVTEVDANGRVPPRSITRGELERRTNRLARALAAQGVRPGTLVTVGLRNGIDFIETCIGVWKCGATPQPVSHRLPDRERAEIIALAQPSLVVTAPVEVDPPVSDRPLAEDLVAPALKAPTSGGSTGRPKLIVSGAPALVDPDVRPGFRASLDGTQLVPGPLYHNAPFVYATSGLFTGNHLVVMTRFDAGCALELIERHRVDWVLLVPTMMSRMLKHRGATAEATDLSSLNGILHLGAPCPHWVKQGWIDLIGAERVWELYAGTEAQGATFIRGDEWLAHRGSVGRVRDGAMRVLDADGNELAPGEVGEIWIRPPEQPTYHYIGAHPRELDGWESLGDLGWIDAEGFLYLADRRSDLILSGGANVYPAEVEAAIDEHPGVVSCAVVPLPDDDLGQRVHAVVQAAGDLDVEELGAFLRERLAPYKTPRSFELVDHPVRDDAGKVRRTALVRPPDGSPQQGR